jgi:hypothetical protein
VRASKKKKVARVLENWLRDPEVQQFLGINRYQGILWFHKEGFEEFLWWMLAVAAVAISARRDGNEDGVAEEIVACYDIIKKLQKSVDASEYQVEKLLEIVNAR